MSSERRPLAGARVVITRSWERAGPLCRLLEDLGARPQVCPVTSICGPTDEEAVALEAAMAALGARDYDWVLLTSVNAVARFFDAYRAAGQVLEDLGGAKLACVGRATEAALKARDLEARVVPKQNDSAGLGRAVIDASGDRIALQRVLIPCAAGGRTEAAEALRAAGARVDVVTLYRSCTAEADAPEVAPGLELLRDRAADVVAFFAPSQVAAMFELLGAGAGALIGACRVVAAIGQTTRAALAERGVSVDAVPPSPTPEALASAIAMEYADKASSPQRADSDER